MNVYFDVGRKLLVLVTQDHRTFFLKKKKIKIKNEMTSSEGGRGACVWRLPGVECPGGLLGGPGATRY